jgi:adenine-specific DNA-methyltransferase
VADFACLEASVIVELDGGQHLDERAYDQKRDGKLQSAGFRVLWFWDNDVLLQTEWVLETILMELAPSPHPSLPPQAGEGG